MTVLLKFNIAGEGLIEIKVKILISSRTNWTVQRNGCIDLDRNSHRTTSSNDTMLCDN